MSSKPVKKVHYTSSTKGSSVHGGPSSTPPTSSKPSSSPRRPSFSHQRHPSDSGVGSSSSNSATAQVNSTSFYTDKERDEQRRNVGALNELVQTLKERVQILELKNLNLENDLSESNREKREFRREAEDLQRTIDEMRKEKSRAKDGREGKESDGIRIRGSDLHTTPEKKEKSDRIPVTIVERNTPPMTRREKERDLEARMREEERLRSQHLARERRTSYRDTPAPLPSSSSPLYDYDVKTVHPGSGFSARYRDEFEEREKRLSGTPPAASSSKLHNPFTPLGSVGSGANANANAGRVRRASVSYGNGSGIANGMSAGTYTGRRERERQEVPYVRGEVPVNVGISISGGTRGSRLSGGSSGGSVGAGVDDLFPNDGKYHPYPLDS
ncbi:hypothetical protein SBOR_9530 [Sclerotinia borealis F-4128]|uniref:Uncharacterized protein n=1 Tax=Sclerotinia borealis (strain F-4128) TaxID=1432307 RepID=W9C591_SCLBF|nr:hypothetical protein SBOR_9530 [Sclerotinia borealis F-4128]